MVQPTRARSRKRRIQPRRAPGRHRARPRLYSLFRRSLHGKRATTSRSRGTSLPNERRNDGTTERRNDGTTERRNGAPMKTGSREQVSRGGDGSESLPRRGPPPGSYPLRRRTRRSVRGRVSGPADPASKPSSSTKMPRRAQAGGTDALVSRGRCGGLVVRGLRGRHARRYLLHGNRESSVAASRRKECRR